MARWPSVRTSPSSRRSLVLASLDIGRALADRDGVTFRAQGTCMYPAVRPRDVLRIRSSPPEELAVGDIAVCRRSGYLFGHRVIELGERDGGTYIVTRPDRSRGGDDGPTFEEHLLGVVVSIERNGVQVPINAPSCWWPDRACHNARLALVEACALGRPWLAGFLGWLHERSLYRQLARLRFARALSRARFAVRVPLNVTLGDAVFREVRPDAFLPEAEWNGRSPDSWTVVALFGRRRSVAGSVEVIRTPEGGWSLGEPCTRVRYGGTGLDEVLRREAAAIVDGDHGPQ